MRINILYIGYWSLTEPLTTSVIIPRLKVLSSLNEVDKVLFCSFERTIPTKMMEPIPKVEHVWFESEQKQNVLFTKLTDFIRWPAFLKQIVVNKKINLLIANSTLAGAAANMIWKTYQIPYLVECFEPHAESMFESGVWKKWDLRYWILRYFEWTQKRNAWLLQTVSYHFTKRLLEEGIKENRILTLPNTVPLDNFKFDNIARIMKRKDLGFPDNAIVGIYVGKFGGIYYDTEAFNLFSQAFHYFGNRFRMIVLSTHDSEYIYSNFLSRGIDCKKIFVSNSPHHFVSQYLSSADFAFATIKVTPVRIFCCPVKNGEYWANGLPILLEEGIGDDSDIIKNEGGGIIFELQDPISGFKKLASLLKEGRVSVAERVYLIADKHRSEELMVSIYKKIITDFKLKALT